MTASRDALNTAATLVLEWDERILVTVFSGEIDLASTDAFEETLFKAFDVRPLGVVIDLSEVRYLDSAAVRLLFLMDRALKSRTVQAVTVSPRIEVAQRILTLVGFPSVMSLIDSRSEALASIKLDKAAATASQLQQALDSRVIIEQAKGILGERHGVDVEEAFERMRSLSRRSRRTVHEIADDVVAGVLDVPS